MAFYVYCVCCCRILCVCHTESRSRFLTMKASRNAKKKDNVLALRTGVSESERESRTAKEIYIPHPVFIVIWVRFLCLLGLVFSLVVGGPQKKNGGRRIIPNDSNQKIAEFLLGPFVWYEESSAGGVCGGWFNIFTAFVCDVVECWFGDIFSVVWSFWYAWETGVHVPLPETDPIITQK